MQTQLTSYFARLFAGDLSAFGGPVTDEAVAGHIRAEQMSLVLGYSVGIMLANACNAGVLVGKWRTGGSIHRRTSCEKAEQKRSARTAKSFIVELFR